MSIFAKKEQTTISDQISQYVLFNKPKLYILTPCYGGMCHLNFVCAMMNTIDVFKIHNFQLQIEFCRNDSLVSRARNNLVAKAMMDPEMTHIMFIDSDITWDPMDIFKLVLSDKGLIGGVYPIKHYNWENIIPQSNASFLDKKPLDKILDRRANNSILSNKYTESDFIQHNLVSYNMNFMNSNLEIDNNIAEVKHIATGFMMIHRKTIETMMQHYSETKYTDDVSFLAENENKYAYALFDCRVEDDHYLSEDWLFCNRWRKIGGKVYFDVSIDLIHTGQQDYKGSYISTIM
jgi:hypothetical protein